MELHCSQTMSVVTGRLNGLRPLWNYTALKQALECAFTVVGLRPLWNYTALKLNRTSGAFGDGLRPLWNYTALKPSPQSCTSWSLFETPMELHCSQTAVARLSYAISLRPLWNYTALKQKRHRNEIASRLRPLWNYTALKQQCKI